MIKHSILIADDDRDLVQVLAARCRDLGLLTHVAYDARSALAMIHEHAPGIVCLDVRMPGGNGLSVCEMIAGDPKLAMTPMIVLTGTGDPETIRRCHSLCAFYVEKCPNAWSRIEPLVRELLKMDIPSAGSPKKQVAGPAPDPASPFHGLLGDLGGNLLPPLPPPSISPTPLAAAPAPPSPWSPRERLVETVFEMLGVDAEFLESSEFSAAREDTIPWILCIDDDADYSQALKLRLEQWGVAVVRAFEGAEGYRAAFLHQADVILLDYEMPNGQGDYVLWRLKDNPVTRDIPVIVITGHKDRMLERKMLGMGAVKFMNKPPDFDELLGELRKHIRLVAVS